MSTTAQQSDPQHGKPLKKGIRTKTLVALIAAIAAILVALIGFLEVLLPIMNRHEPPPSPTPPLPSVSIIFPAEGSKVPGLVIVRGTAHDIPQNEELWLFILPEGATGYFPQLGPIKALSDGTWSVTAYIGQQKGPTDVGKKFVLIPALVDKNDREAQDAIQKYLSQPGPMYKGIEPLPSGIQLQSPISVIRT